MTSTKPPRKRTGPKTAHTKQGERIPLITPIPGGMAKWFTPGELTPRRSRDYELIAAEMAPLIQKTVDARTISGEGGTFVFEDFDGAAVGLSRAELRAFLELTDAATIAYLKEWTLDAPPPADVDELLDLPRPLYEALTRHGAKLLAATQEGFERPADVDDMAEVDENSPS